MLTRISSGAAPQPTEGRAPFCIDPERMAFGPDGVEPFLWPLAQSEVGDVRDAFMTHLVAGAKASLARHHDNAHLFEMLSLYWATTVMTGFQACAIPSRFGRLGWTLEYSAYSHIM